ncbi:hypothetical protein CPB84DRAFT_1782980 [Gymnopilus junonius]|uniref:Uncharacterized protein n=1 Tax=Gymnopilus junonius TaxID=109634 RepID=A0A9P5NKR7_GYMJU|nr:hypothetical protein CPB84DRAFT_1782980 [Gymnopilus junonius]
MCFITCFHHSFSFFDHALPVLTHMLSLLIFTQKVILVCVFPLLRTSLDHLVSFFLTSPLPSSLLDVYILYVRTYILAE